MELALVVPEVVPDEDEHDQLGMERPHECIIEPHLTDLTGVADPESGCRDVHIGQFPGGERFEPDLELVRYGHFPGLCERIADQGDVTAFPRAFGAREFAFEETQAVGARYDPVVEVVRVSHFRTGCPDDSYAGNEPGGQYARGERRRQPEPDFSCARNEDQPHEEEQRIPAGHSQRVMDSCPHQIFVSPARTNARVRDRPAGSDPPCGGSRARWRGSRGPFP